MTAARIMVEGSHMLFFWVKRAIYVCLVTVQHQHKKTVFWLKIFNAIDTYHVDTNVTTMNMHTWKFSRETKTCSGLEQSHNEKEVHK